MQSKRPENKDTHSVLAECNCLQSRHIQWFVGWPDSISSHSFPRVIRKFLLSHYHWSLTMQLFPSTCIALLKTLLSLPFICKLLIFWLISSPLVCPLIWQHLQDFSWRSQEHFYADLSWSQRIRTVFPLPGSSLDWEGKT